MTAARKGTETGLQSGQACQSIVRRSPAKFSMTTIAMPLDPQAKALLDALGITTLQPIETMTPQAARDRSKLMLEARKQMGVEPVHQVRDIKISGPAGEIPVRI